MKDFTSGGAGCRGQPALGTSRQIPGFSQSSFATAVGYEGWVWMEGGRCIREASEAILMCFLLWNLLLNKNFITVYNMINFEFPFSAFCIFLPCRFTPITTPKGGGLGLDGSRSFSEKMMLSPQRVAPADGTDRTHSQPFAIKRAALATPK